MGKPTEEARIHFGIAKTHSREAHVIAAKEKDMFKANSAVALFEIADGLENLTTGIRATYILLEEVKNLLEQQRAGR